MARLYRDPAAPPAPPEYHVAPAASAVEALLDGIEGAWTPAHRIAWGPDPYATSFRAAWSPDALLVRFDCCDDAPWYTRTLRDDDLWREEVVEIFLDPVGEGRCYAEIEISPANVVCDLRIRSPWPSLRSDIGWHFAGLDTRVRAWRDDEGRWRGWTATASMPWEGFASLSEEAAARVPPAPGDHWRFNVFRIKRPGGPLDPERGAIFAAWAVPEGPSFHVPSEFRSLVFSPREGRQGDPR